MSLDTTDIFAGGGVGNPFTDAGSFGDFGFSNADSLAAANGAPGYGALGDFQTALNSLIGGAGISNDSLPSNPLTPDSAIDVFPEPVQVSLLKPSTWFSSSSSGAYLQSVTSGLSPNWYDPTDTSAGSAAARGAPYRPATPGASIIPWNALGTALSATNPFGRPQQQQQASIAPLLMLGAVALIIVLAVGGGSNK